VTIFEEATGQTFPAPIDGIELLQEGSGIGSGQFVVHATLDEKFCFGVEGHV
jgi:hypothetical protein